jgi:putative transposase
LTRTERQELIEWGREELPVAQQAALLEVNRSTLYYRPVPPAAAEIALKHRIDELYTATPMYGYRRISAQLRREGWEVNRKTVAHAMREMGLVGIHPGPNLSKRAYHAGVYPYLLAHLTASYSDHIWGIDITYVKLQHGWMYLVAVLDWYSRYIVSWEVDQTLLMPFVLQAVDRALAQATPTIWNSDQGSHFTSPLYLDRLRAHAIQISMDGRGRALDNIFTERLWRTIKYEEIYLKSYASPREARRELSAYLQWYNQQRLHQSLGYRTPAEVYFSGKKEGGCPLESHDSLS